MLTRILFILFNWSKEAQSSWISIKLEMLKLPPLTDKLPSYKALIISLPIKMHQGAFEFDSEVACN